MRQLTHGLPMGITQGYDGKFVTPNGAYDTLEEAITAIKMGGAPMQFNATPEPAMAQPVSGTIPAGGGYTASGRGGNPARFANPFPPQQQPTGQPTGQQQSGGASFLDNLMSKNGMGTLGAMMLGMSNNQNLARLGAGQLQQMHQQRATSQQANKTLAFLKAQGVDEATLKALADNPQMISAYAASVLKPAKDTALKQNYEFAKTQGFKGSFTDFMKLNSSGTTIYTGDRMGGLNEDYLKEGNKLLAKRHQAMVEAGDVARRSARSFDQLTALNTDTPDGFAAGVKAFAGNYGIELGEGVDNVQAMQSIINKLVPQQRPAGSGPMSDADLELFKKSLPQLMQQASGRQLVIDLIQEINDYDIKRADIAEQMLYGDIDQKEGRRLLKELDDTTTSLRERIKNGNTVIGNF